MFDDKVEDADDVDDDEDDEDEAAAELAFILLLLLLNSCGRKAAKLEGSLPAAAAIAANKEAVPLPPAEPLSTGLKN